MKKKIIKPEIKEKVAQKQVKVKKNIQVHKSIGLASFESAKYINPPNSITIIRILLVGSICTHIINNEYLWAMINVLMCWYTDWLDGYIARKNNQVTEFGAKLDPTADKILNVGILIFALNAKTVFTHTLLGINIIYSITIIETILLLTAWIFKPLLISYGWKKKIGANWFGKTKMVFESTAIALAIIFLSQWLPIFSKEIKILANITLDIAIVLGIFSILGHYSFKNGNPEQTTTA